MMWRSQHPVAFLQQGPLPAMSRCKMPLSDRVRLLRAHCPHELCQTRTAKPASCASMLQSCWKRLWLGKAVRDSHQESCLQ